MRYRGGDPLVRQAAARWAGGSYKIPTTMGSEIPGYQWTKYGGNGGASITIRLRHAL